jgi:ribosomal protein S1/(E)-4-hydroxy-3-methyl-but-2-enyl pyrophosphate reductase
LEVQQLGKEDCSLNIIVAKNAGFCFGVRRAIEAVYKHLDRPGNLFTYGPVIHNPQMVRELKEKGVIVEERVEKIKNGTVVIRSHGVPQYVYQQLANKGLHIVDATCPYVKRVHKLAKEYYDKGYQIIIIGEKEHPEVIGINGWCDNKAFILNRPDEIDSLPQISKACILAQTTTSHQNWDAILQRIHSKVEHLEVFNTICSTTSNRQMEAESIAKIADVMWVIGGRNSSNTRKLYSICKAHCNKTFAIETAKDIDVKVIDPGDTIGITAGASTPDWIIKEVIEKMNQLDEKNLIQNENMCEEPQDCSAEAQDPAITAKEEEVTLHEDEQSAEQPTQETTGKEEVTQEATVEEEITQEATGEEKLDQETTVEEEITQEATGEEKLDQETTVEEGTTQEATEEELGQETTAEDETTQETTMEDFEETMVSLRSGQVVKGTILKITPEEVIVNVGYKSDGIIPANELAAKGTQVEETQWKEGDSIEAEVVKVNDGEGNVLLSRKSIEEKRIWKEIEQGFKSGKEFEGICTEVVKGGVLATIHGIRTFVPASQLSTHYVKDLSIFVDKPLRLRIIELERRRNRVVASQRIILEAENEAKRKALWESIEEGQTIKGIVKRLTNFGAFVDVGGVDGLIHISDLSWGRIDHPSEVVHEEQPIEVLVLSVDRERERISLGYKQTIPHPWENVDQKYPVGDTITGKVVRITSFGAFVELEPGVDGLVHISQVANRRIDRVDDVLSVGQEVQVKVLDVKPDEHRISLSVREALPKQKENYSTQANEDSQYEKEEMTVPLGDFFPDELRDINNKK